MRITGFHVERFGALQDKSIDGFSNGLNVIYGPNGSGKTTLVQFLRAVLYGFPPDRSSRFLPAVHPGRQGGSVSLRANETEFVVSRYSDGVDVGSRDVRTDADEGDRISGRLDQVSESTFNSLFTVGLREADQIDSLAVLAADRSTCEWTEAPELAGINASIEHIQRDRTELIGAAGDGGRRSKLAQELSRLRAELSRISGMNDRARKLLEDLRPEIQRLEVELERRGEEIRRIDASVQELQRKREAALSQHRRHASTGACLVSGFDEIELRIRRWSRWRQEVDEQIAGIERRIESTVLEHAGWSGADERSNLQQPLESVGRIERELCQLIESLRAVGTDTGAIRHGETAGWQDSLEAAREELYGLCRDLSVHELGDRDDALQDQLMQLKRIRSEMSEQLRLLIRERTMLFRNHTPDQRATIDQHRHGLAELCRCREHGDWLNSRLSPPDEPAVQEDFNSEIARLETLRSELQERFGTLRGQIDGLHERRRRLEVEVSEGPASGDVESIRNAIESLERELANIEDRIRELSLQEANLLAQQAECESSRRPRSLVEASQFLARLTEDQYTDITLNADQNGFLVRRADGTNLSVQALSHGNRGQVSLSLRLALANAFSRHGSRLPLIFDDVFITTNTTHARATANLLHELGRDNQQIFFLTCHRHIADLFRSLDVQVRELTPAETPVVTQPVVPAPVVVDAPEPVGPVEDTEEESLVFKAFQGIAEECPGEMEDRVVASAPQADSGLSLEASHWIYYLEITSPVSELSSLSPEEAEELDMIGVHTVEDLIALVPDAAAIRLSHMGLAPERIRQWQAQALMACRVPMMRRRDAELLVLCGIGTPEHLAKLHPDEVFRTVERYLRTSEGRRFVRDDNPFDRQQAINWVRWSRHSRTLWESRESDRSPGETTQSLSRNDRPERQSETTARGTEPDSTRSRSRRISSQSSPAASRSDDGRSRSRRGSRSSTGTSRSKRRRPRDEQTASRTDGEQSSEWKFYLERESHVEEAPSIGPKTAARLERVDIVTVDDLLNADADDAAERLGHRRIRPADIRDWQAQASLVCRIPKLRGHDAQILVACDVTEPDDLANIHANDLFAMVSSFVETREGERIVRSGKKPDLAEINDWIEWAQHARRLRAA